MSAAKMTSTASTGPSTSNDISLVSLFRFEAIRRAGEPPGNAPESTRPPVAAPAYSVSLIMRLLYLVVQWAYYAIFRQPAIGRTACGATRPMKGDGFAGPPMNGNRPRRAYMPEKWERPQNRGRSRGKREKERKGGFRPHARRAGRAPRMGPLGVYSSGPRRFRSRADARPRRSCWRTRCCSAGD